MIHVKTKPEFYSLTKQESEEVQTHPPKHRPETQKPWLLNNSLPDKKKNQKNSENVKYPVGRFVSRNAFWDGGGCRGLIEVGAVIIEQ